MSRYLIRTTDRAFVDRLQAALGVAARVDRVDPNQSLQAALKADEEGAVDVVVLGPDDLLDESLALASSLELEHPETNVILVAHAAPDLFQRALRAGIRDVVRPEAGSTELREVFERAADTAARRRLKLLGDSGREDRSRGRIITVVSPKGGAGKTTVATNLAAGLAAHSPGQVVLVDADLQFGDVAGAMQLQPEHSVADAAKLNGSLDAMTLKVFLSHHPAELYVLCAPDSPAEGELIPGDAISTIVELLGQEFAYVIVDTSAGLSESTLAALEVSTDILAICSMDVPSVRSTRKLLDVLNQLGMTTAQRHFVLNRADAKVGIDPADVEATLGVTMDVVVPSSRSIPLALNQGLPVLHTEPRSPAARQLRLIADRFAPEQATSANAAPRGFFGRKASR